MEVHRDANLIISDGQFRMKQEDEYSKQRRINRSTERVLVPILYLLYIYDIPKLERVTLTAFADDTASLTTGENQLTSTIILHTVYGWTKQ